jgi:hypothetical protein
MINKIKVKFIVEMCEFSILQNVITNNGNINFTGYVNNLQENDMLRRILKYIKIGNAMTDYFVKSL